MCAIIQVHPVPQNGLFSACWNINIRFLYGTQDLHTRVKFLYLEIVAFLLR